MREECGREGRELGGKLKLCVVMEPMRKSLLVIWAQADSLKQLMDADR